MNWLWFVLGAVLSWGMYGPALHAGQMALNKDGVRALLWVGVAYFLVAVLIPVSVLGSQTPQGHTLKGGTISTLAGILGAAGAVCIIWAFKNGGNPAVVMPLVFGGAPLINVLVSMALHPPKSAPSPLLFLGYAMAAVGAFLVLQFKPA